MQNGWTALIRAVRFGHADCARLLIDAGADKEIKDKVRTVHDHCFADILVAIDCALKLVYSMHRILIIAVQWRKPIHDDFIRDFYLSPNELTHVCVSAVWQNRIRCGSNACQSRYWQSTFGMYFSLSVDYLSPGKNSWLIY